MTREVAPGNWHGPWAVAVECGCASDPEGSVDAVHYFYGPFPSRDAAKGFADGIRSRGTIVFRLRPAAQRGT